jgi:hypothetical protein
MTSQSSKAMCRAALLLGSSSMTHPMASPSFLAEVLVLLEPELLPDFLLFFRAFLQFASSYLFS